MVVIVSLQELNETAGTGFTVTMTLSVLPGQPFAADETTYVTVPVRLELFCSVCRMVFPDPEENPVIAAELL